MCLKEKMKPVVSNLLNVLFPSAAGPLNGSHPLMSEFDIKCLFCMKVGYFFLEKKKALV